MNYDYLRHLRDTHPAKEYLDTWAHPKNAFLRKNYPPEEDEPEFDLSAAEKAPEWLANLPKREIADCPPWTDAATALHCAWNRSAFLLGRWKMR